MHCEIMSRPKNIAQITMAASAPPSCARLAFRNCTKNGFRARRPRMATTAGSTVSGSVAVASSGPRPVARRYDDTIAETPRQIAGAIPAAA